MENIISKMTLIWKNLSFFTQRIDFLVFSGQQILFPLPLIYTCVRKKHKCSKTNKQNKMEIWIMAKKTAETI